MYIKRAIEETIKKTNSSFPVVLITGPRQVGKTTVLENIKEENRSYVTLDDPTIRLLAKTDPALFIERYSPPVIIDEIQYAPELLPFIKMEVDKNKRTGDYWITGSQMFHLMKSASESLAGRVGIINLLGFSNSEISSYESKPFTTGKQALLEKIKIRKLQNLNEVYNNIYKGGMPAIYDKNPSLDTFFGSYIDSYLKRDIKDLTQVADEMTFMKFLTAVAARTGQMLNYTDLAKDVGISSPTAKQWISLLVSSGMVYLLEPYYNNILKRSVKTPKMYFLDTGLCAYILKWTNAEILESGAMSGAFFETYVINEIVKSYYNAGKKPPIYYYRDKDQKEIDLILEIDGTLYPIEMKKSATPNKDAIKHFSVLEKTKMPIGTGGVVCMYKDLVPIDKNNWYIPAWLI